jgi:transcriptional regulator with XRE-family HTH domain
MTQTQVHVSRREELGRFLKACRARIGPEEVGLAPGLRRRTSGLRREEVALLAGVGVTWYTWLEQGRPINASAQVFDAIARTLRLDHTEREHLYRLAELTPSRLPWAVEVVPDAVREVLRVLDPLPATVVNGRFDILESNAAHEEMFWEWHSLPCLHKNLLWCCVTEPNARAYLLNYDEEVSHMIARMRTEYGRHLGDPSWEEDIRRLSALSPEFAELWARNEVAEPRARLRRFDHPRAGLMNIRLTELAVSEVPGLRIQVSTPEDAATWARLPATRRRQEDS